MSVVAKRLDGSRCHLVWEVRLCPGDIVLDGYTAPPLWHGAHHLHFSANVYYGQMAGWIRIPLGTEVSLGPGDIVLDGVPDPATERGTVRLCGFRHISIPV